MKMSNIVKLSVTAIALLLIPRSSSKQADTIKKEKSALPNQANQS